MSEVVQEKKNEDPFSLYWVYYRIKCAIVNFAREHKKMFILLFSLVLSFTFVLRAVIQPYVLALRIYSFDFILAGLAIVGIWGVGKSKMTWKKYVLALVLGAGIFSLHDYMTLMFRNWTLETENITELMETTHERIQPLNSVRDNLNRQFATQSYQFNDPRFMRGATGDYRWTAGREPVGGVQSYLGNVDQMANVSAADSSPDYSNRIQVRFPVGETLHFARNSKVATIRSMGLIRFFSCEPDGVGYVEETKGNPVQIVPLTRYAGLFYPWPEFGGVQIIRQNEGGVIHFFQTILWGDGEYVAPEDIGKYPFLKGQNLVPYKVARFMAESFSFRNGIMENMPRWNTNGAIRIPDLPGDQNDQPFAVCFKQANGEEKIFQYFGLEPLPKQMHGMSLSLFVPGDGIGPVKVYDHNKNGDILIGVSAVAGNVRAADQHIDWNNTTPSEHRPFIRKILGKMRFFWLTTLVSNSKNTGTKENGIEEHNAGGVPNIMLTEAHMQHPVVVDAMHPETWVNELEKVFASSWR